MLSSGDPIASKEAKKEQNFKIYDIKATLGVEVLILPVTKQTTFFDCWRAVDMPSCKLSSKNMIGDFLALILGFRA